VEREGDGDDHSPFSLIDGGGDGDPESAAEGSSYENDSEYVEWPGDGVCAAGGRCCNPLAAFEYPYLPMRKKRKESEVKE
jgi:hypothetical protein